MLYAYVMLKWLFETITSSCCTSRRRDRKVRFDLTKSKATSSNGPSHTMKYRNNSQLTLFNDDSRMPPPVFTNNNEFRFSCCSAGGCSNTSVFSEYNAMTLRAGFITCTNHTTEDVIKERVSNTMVSTSSTFIFYDIEVTNTNEIDQSSAVTADGDSINLVFKTSDRKNNSPVIGKLRPMVYIMLVTEPATAMTAFIEWVDNAARRNNRGQRSDSDVVLVAHNGMNQIMYCF